MVVSRDTRLSQAPIDHLGRRTWLRAAAAALGGAVVAAVAPRDMAEAATPTVKLGRTNTASTGTTVKHSARSSNARALTGRTTYTGGASNAAGVQGIADGRDGNGVIGTANNGTDAAGVWGRSSSATGVYGSGVQGVIGSASGGSESVGIMGLGADGGPAVTAFGGTTETSIGLYATADGDGWAAYLDGDVYMTGEFYAPEIAIAMDHPDAPGERWYRQAAVGSFERLSIISGNVRTGADGTAVVEVPALFARLHRGFRYQLTVIGSPASAHVSREMRRGRFVVRTDRPRVKVSWQVTALRDDPSSRASEFRPSVAKGGSARGRLLEPALYGKASGRAIGARVFEAARRQGRALLAKRQASAGED